MKKLSRLIFWAIAIVLLYKAALWSYEQYATRDQVPAQQEVLDIDKDCLMDADTGRCICRHKRTGEYLKVPYDECKERAMNPL